MTLAGSRGHLAVTEPSHVGSASSRYAWDLRFNNQKPMDLDVKCGAGSSRLDLGDLTLRRVNVEMGVGELRMDLRGAPMNDYAVSIRGGVGEATVYLPENVGIEADVEGGIGGIHAPAWRSGMAGTSTDPMATPRPRCVWISGAESARSISSRIKRSALVRVLRI